MALSAEAVQGLVLLLAATLVHVLSLWFVRWLQRSRGPLAMRVAKAFTPAPDGRIAELYWIHFSLMALMWPALLLLELRLFGLQERSAELLDYLVEGGFTFAGFKIVPVRIVLGLFVAAVLVSLARRLRVTLIRVWASREGGDVAARESVATLVGYAGMVVAVLFGITVAGFNLTNLAIIAGALSVGIGFGLQNIVNNFVSGLILLGERPVRRGDYVQVGTIEGEVRNVHIRATEIETLDRVTVLVPNSELISQPLHNWRLRDPYIRIVIPVGVAYGSDVRLVERLLVELGFAHPLTLPAGTPGVPDTHVYFTGFGNSSLDFELRTFIRDVNKRGKVASDLRFAIDAAFREHGITIPFPQRDVWMRGGDDAST